MGEGAGLLRGFARDTVSELIEDLLAVTAQAPFRHMVTPGGHTMSVAMTNCGAVGWVTDSDGYHYSPVDPKTNQPWPVMPALFRQLAERMQSVELAGPIQRLRSSFVGGIKHMPIRYRLRPSAAH